jgi:hypothetical protein
MDGRSFINSDFPLRFRKLPVQRAWDLIRYHTALRLLGLPAFLKILLPIETLAGLGLPESGPLQEKWEAAYVWLTHQEN